MKISLQDILKLVLSFALTGYILYITITGQDLNWAEIRESLKSFNYGWILLSIFMGWVSHYLRAYRWTLLLKTKGYKPGVNTTFLAVMVGYLTNMAIPRLGEVTRCSVLKSEKNIPVSFSLGTVITDRLLDLFMLGVCTLLLIATQFNVIGNYFREFADDKVPFLLQMWPYLLLAGIVGVLVLFWLVRKSRKAQPSNSLLYKISNFVTDLLEGVKSLKKVPNQLGLWLSTLAIWILYFLMLYVISFGFAPTADLSLYAGLAVLVMGSLGMATPTASGIGAYQAFVAGILVIYGISFSDGYIFAVVSHGSQIISAIVVGILSVIMLNFRKRKRNSDSNSRENNRSTHPQVSH